MPIHDQGYQRYLGTRSAIGKSWQVMTRAGVMSVVTKRIFIGMMLWAWVPFIYRVVQIYVSATFTQAAFLAQWPELLARVPTAKLYVVAESRLMHAKVGVMDGVLSFVGSYNLDPLSAGVNGEVLTTVWSERFAAAERDMIFARIANGSPGVVEYTIAKDLEGRAVLKDGKPIVTKGPEDHCDAAQLERVKKMEPVLELLAPLI